MWFSKHSCPVKRVKITLNLPFLSKLYSNFIKLVDFTFFYNILSEEKYFKGISQLNLSCQITFQISSLTNLLFKGENFDFAYIKNIITSKKSIVALTFWAAVRVVKIWRTTIRRSGWIAKWKVKIPTVATAKNRKVATTTVNGRYFFPWYQSHLGGL